MERAVCLAVCVGDSLDDQLQMNRGQLDQRIAMGDQLTTPRPVEHFAGFRRTRQAREAATALELLGYDVTVRRRPLAGATVEASRIDAVDMASMDAFVREVFHCVAAHGGTYDGWGAEAVGA
jgi:hypothetical protein